MTESRNRTFAKLAKDVNAAGDITTAAISADVSFGVDVYDSTGVLPYVGNTAGDQAFVNSNNRLYIWQGSGWYNVALINRAPSISSVQDSDGNTTPFTLAIDGTVTTITITAADSDGDPITYSATADSDFNGLASITNNGNEFTITPFSSDSATTESGTITFKATDGVNIASSGVQTFTLNFLSALWDETVLSIGMADSDGLDNSTFIDRSTNTHTVTPTGTPIQTAFHPYLDNWSLEIPSGTNYVQMATNAAYALSDAFTLEAWVKTTVESCVIMTTQIGSNNDYWGINISNGYVFHNFRTPSLQANGSASTYIADGLWHHVAMVRASGSTTVTVYVDGQSDDTFTWSTTLLQDPIAFGAGLYPGFENYSFIGNISNARISDVARYTSNFTPSTEKFTSDSDTQLLVFQDNRFIDRSSVGNSFTLTGSPKISSLNPFGQGSEYAAGENKGSVYLVEDASHVYIDDTSIGTWTNDFEFGCWINNQNNTLVHIFGQHQTGTLSSARWCIFFRPDLVLFYYDNGNTEINESVARHLYEWNYVQVVGDGTGNISAYLNGDRVGTDSGAAASVAANSVDINIGADDNGADNNGTCYIADLYFRNNGHSIDPSQTTTTLPTSPVGNTNASLYLPMDNPGIFDKTGLNTLTLAGNTSASNTQTKFADTAMYFDGTGDGLAVEDNPKLFAFGTNDFTIEMWVYVNAFTNQYSILYASRPVSTNGPYVLIPIENDGKVYLYTQTAVRITSSPGTITTGQWYHIALCRSGSNSKLFVDGTQVGSTYVDTNNYDNPAGRPTIGSDSYFADLGTNSLNGYIENLQVLNGVAKYTSNFTVPSQEQGRTYQAED